ncbi:MAG: photosynthetic reaction center subunit H [Pseudomonadota bacterium]
MPTGAITAHIDVALVVLYLFWAFFAGLIYYLRREDQREGYEKEPLEGDFLSIVVPTVPQPKAYHLDGGKIKLAPDYVPDDREVKAVPVATFEGAALEPTGNPLVDGVGPAAYAEREDVPETNFEGKPKIQPLRAIPSYFIAEGDDDPRGMVVISRDGVVVGTVKDAWVDIAEALIRYLEVDVDASIAPARSVLVPINFTFINGYARSIGVPAINASQYKLVPGLAKRDVVTKLEEDKISAYFAGGAMYADTASAAAG